MVGTGRGCVGFLNGYRKDNSKEIYLSAAKDIF